MLTGGASRHAGGPGPRPRGSVRSPPPSFPQPLLLEAKAGDLLNGRGPLRGTVTAPATPMDAPI